MSTKANYVKLGMFVLAGIGAVLLSLLLLGVGKTLKRPFLVETYLDQSVQGLAIGSKVSYRGVPFGEVHAISFSRDRYEEGKPIAEQRSYILIEVAVNEAMYAAQGLEAFREFIKQEVGRGLRFRLNAQGITGLSYLELDYVNPRRFPILAVTWTPENLYIPSAPGTLTRLLTAIEQVFQKLEGVDISQVLTNLNQLLATAETEVRNARLGTISGEATNLLSELRGSNLALRKILEDPRWKDIPAAAGGTLEMLRERLAKLDVEGLVRRLDGLLLTADGFLAGKESDLGATLANLRVLSENLRALSEQARAHPAGLLLGAPPKPVQSPP